MIFSDSFTNFNDYCLITVMTNAYRPIQRHVEVSRVASTFTSLVSFIDEKRLNKLDDIAFSCSVEN